MTPLDAPHVRGSDTSEAAARSLTPERLSAAERDVFGVIALYGERGVTDDAIEIRTGLSHQSASARRNALVKAGVVCDSGRRAPTRSGRSAVLWILGAGTPLEGAPNDRVSLPTEQELTAAEAEIGALISAMGAAPSEQLQKVRRWLRHIAR